MARKSALALCCCCLLIGVLATTAAAQDVTAPAAEPAANATEPAANATAAAANATAAPVQSEIPAGATALRVATVQRTETGPVITLAGQLSSGAQLAETLAASTELLAVLTPELANTLSAVAAQPGTAIDDNPATVEYLASLNNPIDANALIMKMAELARYTSGAGMAAGQPAVAAGEPAPAAQAAQVAAPAPTSSGASAIAAQPLLATIAALLFVAALVF